MTKIRTNVNITNGVHWRQVRDSNPRVGSEPTHKISSLGRYDHFGNLPYLIAVFDGNGETLY